LRPSACTRPSSTAARTRAWICRPTRWHLLPALASCWLLTRQLRPVSDNVCVLCCHCFFTRPALTLASSACEASLRSLNRCATVCCCSYHVLCTVLTCERMPIYEVSCFPHPGNRHVKTELRERDELLKPGSVKSDGHTALGPPREPPRLRITPAALARRSFGVEPASTRTRPAALTTVSLPPDAPNAG